MGAAACRISSHLTTHMLRLPTRYMTCPIYGSTSAGRAATCPSPRYYVPYCSLSPPVPVGKGRPGRGYGTGVEVLYGKREEELASERVRACGRVGEMLMVRGPARNWRGERGTGWWALRQAHRQAGCVHAATTTRKCGVFIWTLYSIIQGSGEGHICHGHRRCCRGDVQSCQSNGTAGCLTFRTRSAKKEPP